MLVYLLRNKCNEKIYVGQTRRSWSLRRKWHLNQAHRSLPVQPISRAIKKYGFTSFEEEILSEAQSAEQLNNLEKVWIILLRATDSRFGYNLQQGGHRGAHNEKTKLRISATMKSRGLCPSKETRDKGRLTQRLLGFSQETRKKMRLAKLGKPSTKAGRSYPHLQGRKVHTSESKARIAASRIGKPTWNGKKHTPESRKKIGDAQKGLLNHAFGKPAHNRGMVVSEEIRQRMRDGWARRKALLSKQII